MRAAYPHASARAYSPRAVFFCGALAMIPTYKVFFVPPMPGLPEPSLLSPPWEKLTRGALSVAIPLSLVFHAIVVSTHFAFEKGESASPPVNSLEVVLVNARSKNAPKDATLIAQHNLDGGGDQEKNARATTPLPSTHQSDGDALSDAVRRRPETTTVSAPTKVITAASSDGETRAVPVKEAKQEDRPAPAPTQRSGQDEVDSVATASELRAEIHRKMNAYEKRPKYEFIGSRTKGSATALYIDQWRQKVERVGTLNFPVGRRGKLYGKLVITVWINGDGTVKEIKPSNISPDKTTGNRKQDDDLKADMEFAAIQIIKKAAPFAALTEEERSECRCDGVVISRTLHFTKDNELVTDEALQ